MKAHVKIPRGWRRLRKGKTIIARDRYLCGADRWLVTNSVGYKVGDYYSGVAEAPYIRRIQRPAQGRAKK